MSSWMLAAGFMGTPATRGMTWKWRWNTSWPPAASLNCIKVMPSAEKARFAALAMVWAAWTT